ncbi:MAG: hypothetical protein JNM34_03650 [Chthonomonadaceae bacterium]|nr:hypothetical protein [Chthonomonadaceae bacterium]
MSRPLALALAVAGAAAGQAQTYRAERIVYATQDGPRAWRINNLGAVLVSDMRIYSRYEIISLNGFGVNHGKLAQDSINASGNAVQTPGGYLWGCTGDLIPLFPWLATYLVTRDVNARGEVVGTWINSISQQTGSMFWSPQTGLQAIPPLQGASRVLQGLNDRGEATGFVSRRTGTRGLYWSRATGAVQIPDFDATDSRDEGLDVLPDGRVMGTSSSRNGSDRFWSWRVGDAAVTPLETFAYTNPYGVNAQGHFCGFRAPGKASLWSPETRDLTLQDHLAEPVDDDLVYAEDINDKGQIAVSAEDPATSRFVPYVLTPVSRVTGPDRLDTGGQAATAGATALAAKDGRCVTVSRFATPNRTDPVTIEVSAALPSAPWYIWLRSTAKASVEGCTLTGELYHWPKAGYDTEYKYTWTLGRDWRYGETIAKLQAKEFRGPDGAVKARLTVTPPEGLTGLWSVTLDEAAFEWVQTPG